MPNRPSQKPSKPKEHFKTIASAIALFMAGVTITFIIMSQTTPLKEELRDTRDKYQKILKENEVYTKQNRDHQLICENLSKENSNLKSDLDMKIKEIDKLKTQLKDATAEIKRLSAKKSKPQSEVNEKTIQKKQTDSETKRIELNSTMGFLNDNIYITLRDFDDEKRNNITAVVHSTGYPEMAINNGVAGMTYVYRSDKAYEIRIMSISLIGKFHGNSFNYADFLVRVK
jgi:hypothetical protein